MSSTRRWLAIVRLVGAGVLGYALIVALTSLGFGSWLGNPVFSQAHWTVQTKGALVALVAGLSGGALAALLGGRHPLRHTLAVVPFLLVDSIYVLFFFEQPRDPFLFDLGAALALIAATLFGGWLVSRLRSQRRPAGAAA